MVIVVVNPWTGKSGGFVSEIIGYNNETIPLFLSLAPVWNSNRVYRLMPLIMIYGLNSCSKNVIPGTIVPKDDIFKIYLSTKQNSALINIRAISIIGRI